MDYAWVEEQLRSFVDEVARYSGQHSGSAFDGVVPTEDALLARATVIKEIVQAVSPDKPWRLARRGYTYTFDQAREAALEALALVRAREILLEKLSTEAPRLAADTLHPWVWQAARSLWDTRHYRAAVQQAATSVDIRLQEKVGRTDSAGTVLAREVFSSDAASESRPRLRLPGDRTGKTWKSRQAGVRDFAAGCFEAVRNPVTHELTEIGENEALEQLAALSLLSRWIDASEVEYGATPRL